MTRSTSRKTRRPSRISRPTAPPVASLRETLRSAALAMAGTFIARAVMTSWGEWSVRLTGTELAALRETIKAVKETDDE